MGDGFLDVDGNGSRLIACGNKPGLFTLLKFVSAPKPALLSQAISRDRIVCIPLLLLSAITLLLLPGCGGSYAIRGKVIQGPMPMIAVVSSSDPRLSEDDPSGAGAVIEGIFEPENRIDRRSLGRVVAGPDGAFALPVDALGAGFLQYEAALIVRREGFQGAMETIALPNRRQRVLIVLPRGRDTLRVPENYLDQTLRDAAPYLED